MKKVRIKFHLAALTRVVCDFEKEVEVPDDVTLTECRLREMAREEYDEVDGGDFVQDYDYWERGDCWAEVVKDE